MHRYSNLWFCDQLIVEIAAQQFGDEENLASLPKQKAGNPGRTTILKLVKRGSFPVVKLGCTRLPVMVYEEVYK